MTEQTEYVNEKELKQQEQVARADLVAERRERRKGNDGWIGGLVMVTIGVIFLVSNYTSFTLNNWWALFILIPVVAIWGDALRTYNAVGRFTGDIAGKLIGSLFPLFVASIFLFGWDWGRVWPGFIILAGLGALVGGWFRD